MSSSHFCFYSYQNSQCKKWCCLWLPKRKYTRITSYISGLWMRLYIGIFVVWVWTWIAWCTRSTCGCQNWIFFFCFDIHGIGLRAIMRENTNVYVNNVIVYFFVLCLLQQKLTKIQRANNSHSFSLGILFLFIKVLIWCMTLYVVEYDSLFILCFGI